MKGKTRVANPNNRKFRHKFIVTRTFRSNMQTAFNVGKGIKPVAKAELHDFPDHCTRTREVVEYALEMWDAENKRWMLCTI